MKMMQYLNLQIDDWLAVFRHYVIILLPMTFTMTSCMTSGQPIGSEEWDRIAQLETSRSGSDLNHLAPLV